MLNLLLSSSIPFYPQNFGVELVATWSDGKDSTAALDVEVKDGWVYLIWTPLPNRFTGDSVFVLDANDFENIRKVYSMPTPSAEDLLVYGDLLYVAFRDKLQVYSLDNPSHPDYITLVNAPNSGWEKGLSARTCVFELPPGDKYLCFRRFICSLNNPDTPKLVYSPTFEEALWHFPIGFLPPRYFYAFSNYSQDSLSVVDLSDPRNPKLLNKIPISPYSWSGTLWFDQEGTPYLLIGTWYLAKIFVYSLENPEEPVLVRTIPASSRIVTSHGPRVYCSEFALYVLENLAAGDTVVGFYDHRGAAREIVFYKNLIYMANRLWGNSDTPQYDLYIFHYVGDTPQTFNAWFSKGNLFLELPNPSEVRVSLYDFKGSLIFKRELSLPWGESSVPLETPPSRGIYLALVERKGTNQRRVVKCWW